MAMNRQTIQPWFLMFAALMGLLSLFPYRERALLPVPSATEQGFLAREITRQGPEQIVSDAITGTSGQQTLGGGAASAAAGARRLIPALVRAAAVPGTTTLADVLGTGTAPGSLPGATPGSDPSGQSGAAGNGTGGAPGTGGTNLAAGPGANPGGGANGGLTGGGNGPTAPIGPAVLAGTASQLLSSVVPEPSTWLMFIAGLLIVGYALRRSPRSVISGLPQS